ncbi:MAG TPA: thiol reductase thioredoxin [Bacteroidales bacterium]|nr:thiol reductase thioredoxin [Bacteroidales bacterium]HBQ81624.1 thiol reductase thioredoxin [Bacteroidales bacterium]HCU18602.1 thiol reductase thioredoxin [Bacteroidales bacterium]
MKKKILLSVLVSSMFFINCRSENPAVAVSKGDGASSVVILTNDSFKKLVFNYELNKEWKYEGDIPAIIDFYADWCAPCRQLSPLVEEIAKEYKGKIVVYKVDTEKEKALSQSMGITGLPTLLFIPAEGQPRLSMGALPKESLVKAVNEILLVK